MKRVVLYLVAAVVLITACNKEEEDKDVLVTGITLNRATLGLVLDDAEYGKATLTATIEPADATNKKFTWSVSDGNSVSVADGVVTAIRLGTSTVTVTSDCGGHKDHCVVEVTENIIDVVSVTIEVEGGGAFEVEEGSTLTLRAVYLPANATRPHISWGSSNSSVASVNTNTGVVTGVARSATPVKINVTVSTPGPAADATTEVDVTVLPPGVLNQPKDEDIWYINAKLSWKDGFDVTHIVVIGTDEGNDFEEELELTEEMLNAGYIIVSDLTPDKFYKATIFNDDEEFNSFAFKTPAVPFGEVDVPVWADLEDFVFNHARNNSIINLEGGGAEYPDVRFRIRTSITIKGGEGGTVITTAGNGKMFGLGVSKMQIVFDGIHFVFTGATGADLFNVDGSKAAANGPSINVELLAFKNCIIEGFGRNMWQTSDNDDIVDEFLIENCIITGHLDGGNRRVVNWPNASNKLGKVVIKNSTFVNVNRVVNASLEAAPTEPAETEAIVENCTFYDVATGTENLFDYNNKHAKVNISNSLFAEGKAATSNIARTSGEKIATNNFHLNDFAPGNNSIPDIEEYDKNSDEVFTDPAKFDFSIKDVTFKAEGAGDPWLKVIEFK